MNIEKRIFVLCLLVLLSVSSKVVAQVPDVDYSNYHLVLYDDFDYPNATSTYPDTTFRKSYGMVSTSGTTVGKQFKDSWYLTCDNWGIDEIYTEYQLSLQRAGILRMTEVQVPAFVPAGDTAHRHHLSGQITSKGNYGFGIIEARIRLPQTPLTDVAANGAFWTNAGPGKGKNEIDILDDAYRDMAPCRVMDYDYYIPYVSAPYIKTLDRTPASVGLTSFSDTFHTYSAEWEPGQVKFYIDGHFTNEMSDSDVRIFTGIYSFQIALLTFIDAAGHQTTGGETMDVDWVKVYKPTCKGTDMIYTAPTSAYDAILLPFILNGLYKYENIILDMPVSTWGAEAPLRPLDKSTSTIFAARSTTILPDFIEDQTGLNTVPYGTLNRVTNGYFEIKAVSCDTDSAEPDYMPGHVASNAAVIKNNLLTNREPQIASTVSNAPSGNSATADMQIYTPSESGVAGKDFSIHLSPNPTSGLTKIDCGGYRGNIQVKVSDINGATVLQSSQCLQNDGALNIDLSGFSPGIYIVDVVSDKQHVTKRVTKI